MDERQKILQARLRYTYEWSSTSPGAPFSRDHISGPGPAYQPLCGRVIPPRFKFYRPTPSWKVCTYCLLEKQQFGLDPTEVW